MAVVTTYFLTHEMRVNQLPRPTAVPCLILVSLLEAIIHILVEKVQTATSSLYPQYIAAPIAGSSQWRD
jgi:hypothetical protein